jgi:hypothetical protein
MPDILCFCALNLIDDDVKSWTIQNSKILYQHFDTVKNILARLEFSSINDDLVYLEYLISSLKGNLDKKDSIINEKVLHF